MGTTLIGGADTPAPGVAGDSVTALLTNLLPTWASPQVCIGSSYVGEGLPLVRAKLAIKIWRGAYMDMGELLPEFWASTREDDQPNQEAKA